MSAERLSSLRSGQLGQQVLKPRLFAQAIVIRIVFDPPALSPAAREHALQQVKRLVLVTQFGAEARRVDECAHILGVKLYSASAPLPRSRRFTDLKQSLR